MREEYSFRARRLIPVCIGLAGFIGGLVALTAALGPGSSLAAPAGPYRAYFPQLANDETHRLAGRGCGEERWAVKTLSDSGASSVNFGPVATTVDQLRLLPKPSSYPDTSHSWAQWFHDNYDPTDINKLDSDHDGVVCESLPG